MKYVETMRRIGVEVAAPNADSVDAESRFPHETIDAIKREKLLSCAVPKELGGMGANIVEVSSMCETLGEYCSSSAMVFAMHQIKAGTIARWGVSSPWYQRYMRELVDKQLLIGSITTEGGVGGDIRTSICAIERNGDTFVVNKDSPVISYGDQADDLLMTARANPNSASSDQSLVLVRKADYTLEKKFGWNVLGMRGTVSPGYMLRAKGEWAQVFETPFAVIGGQTMLPYTHILWSSLWTGIAAAAVSRASQFVRNEARKKPGTTPPMALRLAETLNRLQSMRNNLHAVVREYHDIIDNPSALSEMSFGLKVNNLKITAAEAVVDVVGRAMIVCGISGYRNDSPYSIGRLLRDAYSAPIQIANDRIYANNAQMTLVVKDVL